MNLEKCIKVKKYTSNHNLAKIEKWLRQEAKNGNKLMHVKSGAFISTYYFLEAQNCDEVYFAPADFAKNAKFTRTSLSVLSYLKSKYGAKRLSKVDYCLWIRLSKSNITDLNDVKANLLARESCIKKHYLEWLFCYTIPTVGFAILSFFDATTLLLCSIFFAGFLITLIQLLLHQKYCKEIYTDFLED